MANDFSSYRLDSMRELQLIDMKVERMAIDVQSIDMRVDRMATEFNEFRLDTMQAFRSMQDSMQEAFEFMRKQYHPGHHDTHMHDATEDVAMGDEGGVLDLNMNMVDDDSEVQYITPSKMVQREPRIKKQSEFLKSPFVMTTDTRETLKNTLPYPPEHFNPKRDFSEELSTNFWTYFTSDMDPLIDMTICDVNKEFFNILLNEGYWLNEKRRLRGVHAQGNGVHTCKHGDII
ncbi:hypothetical protein FNV43_RR04231 [Rhamnella rubrinervis]|uniref:Uncharacterized protein n=1 Tax=Rhamnella rubrinervis TaxID=2594499 RepID=A0A8K0HJY0_9ROSA|nr:hypothetical protein FNV43_RR04231 [Rhamnella rubrinervis]